MKTALLFIAIMLIALVVISVIAKRRGSEPSEGERPRVKRLLTKREEAMFNRLSGALPDAHVLAQVSFGALLSAKTRQTRNTFDRKIADFVICDRALQVIAVVELDDASHNSKENSDKARDALLTNAGYRVVRYANIPDIDQVQRDFKKAEEAKGAFNANNDEPTRAGAVNAASAVLARKTESEQERTAQRATKRPH